MKSLKMASKADGYNVSCFGRAGIVAACFLATTAGILRADSVAPTSLTVSVSLPAAVLKPVTTSQGTWLRPEGANNEQEGHPQIAVERFSLLLPPEADLKSLKLVKTSFQTRVHSVGVELAPCGQVMLDAGVPLNPDLELDGRGRNASLYASAQPYPDQVARITGSGQMRNVKFVNVEVARMRYRPLENHKIEEVTNCTLTVSFQRTAGDLPPDNVGPRFRERLAQAFLNGADAARFYPPYFTNNFAPVGWNYLIITTDSITNDSTQLANFKAHKEALGFRVMIKTVEQIHDDLYAKWVAARRMPLNQEPANLIRWWLQDKYRLYGTEYVLLIGDPDPWDCDDPGDAVGAVPMKMMWAYPDEEYPHAPTHYYFADLTETWDGDGDGYSGEFAEDAGGGSWDLCPEVYVGQIPFETAQYVDPILEKFMAYENEGGAGRPIWRSSVLLANSFLDSQTDTAYLAEELKNGILRPRGYSPYTMYQHQTAPGGISNAPANSAFASDADLISYSMVGQWSANPYGLICWDAHGSEVSAYVGNEETGDQGYLIQSSNIGYLDNAQPSLVLSASCLNGSPSFGSQSLAATLLLQGAIGVVSSSDVGSYIRGMTSYDGSSTSGGLCREMIEDLIQRNKTFGQALYDSKFDLGTPSQGWQFRARIVFNLYGDPAMDWHSWCLSGVDPVWPPNPTWIWK